MNMQRKLAEKKLEQKHEHDRDSLREQHRRQIQEIDEQQQDDELLRHHERQLQVLNDPSTRSSWYLEKGQNQQDVLNERKQQCEQHESALSDIREQHLHQQAELSRQQQAEIETLIQRHNQEKSTLELVDDPQRYASSICKQDHVREADDEGAEVPKMITKDTPVCAPRPHGMGEDAVIREGFNQRWMSQQADYQHDYSRDESVDEQLQEQEAEVSSFRTEFEQVSQNVDIRTDE